MRAPLFDHAEVDVELIAEDPVPNDLAECLKGVGAQMLVGSEASVEGRISFDRIHLREAPKQGTAARP